MRIKKCVLIEKKEMEDKYRYVLRSSEAGNDVVLLENQELSMYIGGIYDLDCEKGESAFVLHSFTENVKAMEKKLSQIKISKDTAAILLKTFQSRIFEVMKDTPEELEKVKGIGKKRAASICENYNAYEAQTDMRQLLILQSEYDLSDRVAKAVAAKYRGELNRVIEDPYLLCEVREIPFSKVDRVYLSKNPDTYDKKRLRAAAKLSVKRFCRSTGSMAVPPHELIDGMGKLLGRGMQEEALKAFVNQLIRERTLIYQYRLIYDEWHYQMEKESADRLRKLVNGKVKPIPVSDKRLLSIEKECGITLDEHQREGVYAVANHAVTLITGGPGTGKSTLVNVLIAVIRFFLRDAVIALLAPTGRAASRLTEITGEPASTIHSALHLSFDEESNNLERMEDADVIIVDETSMVSMALAHKILIAAKRGSRLIFIGDPNQLPSVQEGAFLRDLVFLGQKGIIGYVSLTRVFRQGISSNIPILADSIIDGTLNHSSMKGDIKAIPLERTEEIAGMVLSVIRRYIEMGVSPEDIMVLAPIKKKEASPLSTHVLNEYLQEALNRKVGSQKEIRHNGILYREGSRVIQTVNVQEAMNGDLGHIVSVGENEVKVSFDSGKEKTYQRSNLSELELAFSITVHKAQGSQFPVVILPLHESYHYMAKRDIYYTAVTRASKALLLIGDLSVLDRAANAVGRTRISYFGYRVLSSLENSAVKHPKEKTARAAKESERQMSMFEELGMAS